MACKKQTAVSHSSTDAVILSIDAGLQTEGIPAMSLWDTVIVLLHLQAGGDSKLVHQTQTLKRQEPFGNIDNVLPNSR